jgi:hypothetical protein
VKRQSTQQRAAFRMEKALDCSFQIFLDEQALCRKVIRRDGGALP